MRYWSLFFALFLCFTTPVFGAVELDADSNGATDVGKGGTNSTTAAGARTNLGVPATASTLAGSCTVGPCLDGTSDGGDLIKLYGPGGFWTALQAGNAVANRSWRLPLAAPPTPGTTRLMNMDEDGQMGFVDPAIFQPDLAVPSQAEAEGGTATTERVWTAERVKQAIEALGGSGTIPDGTIANMILQWDGDSWEPTSSVAGLIDDTAGDGDVDKLLSADRVVDLITAGGGGTFTPDAFPAYEDSAHTSGIAWNSTALAVYDTASSKWLTTALTDTLDPSPAAPTVTSVTVGTLGLSADILFNTAISAGIGGPVGWSMICDSVPISMTYDSGLTTSTLAYTLGSTPFDGDTCTVDFEQPGDGLVNGASVELASITNGDVTNNSEVIAGGYLFSWDAETTTANLSSGTVTGTVTGDPMLSTDYAASPTQSLKATGGSDYYRFTANAYDPTGGTIRLKMYGNYTAVGSQARAMAVYGDASNNIEVHHNTTNRVTFYHRLSGANVYATSSNSVMLPGQWNDVVFTYAQNGGATDWSLTVNGSAAGSGSTANLWNSGITPVRVDVGTTNATAPIGPIYVDDVVIE